MSRHETLDIHNYLHGVKEDGEEFKKQYENYLEKYALPTYINEE